MAMPTVLAYPHLGGALVTRIAGSPGAHELPAESWGGVSLRVLQTAKANMPMQFGFELNHLIDIDEAFIVDVEATPARNL
jgi:hypothetical protein